MLRLLRFNHSEAKWGQEINKLVFSRDKSLYVILLRPEDMTRSTGYIWPNIKWEHLCNNYFRGADWTSTGK